ncbi:MAG: hypothetical protein ACJ72M_20605, partial [Propionibacteriaceae bacterium]
PQAGGLAQPSHLAPPRAASASRAVLPPWPAGLAAAGSYVAELWFFSTALSAADRDELYADERAFFGLP